MAINARMNHRARSHRILVTAYGHIADTLPALTALHDLRGQFPQSRISVLVLDYVRELFETSPHVDTVLTFRDFQLKGSRFSKLEQLLRLTQLAPKVFRKFDMVVILHAHTSFFARVAQLSRAPIRAGFEPSAPRQTLTHRARPLTTPVGFREENRHVLEAVGVTACHEHLELGLAADDMAYVEGILAGEGVHREDTVVGLHPGSHWTCQEWNAEHWAKIADELQTSYRARIVITGTADEKALAADIIRHMPSGQTSVINLTGKTSILQFAAMIRRMDLLVCVNSAASQLALAMGTRAINLVGYENPVWTAPRPDEPMTILRGCNDGNTKTSWCPYGIWGRRSGCHRAECTGIGGLSLITTDMVTRRIQIDLDRCNGNIRSEDYAPVFKQV